MVFRKLPFKFGKFHVKNRSCKYIINELPKTFNDAVYPQLPFLTRSEQYRIKCKVNNNPAGQLYNQTFAVTNLFRDERIRVSYNKAAEIRPHVELLIIEAMRHGDKHRPTMALANYWLREKNLIHKLFKVFVPRYLDYASAFTALHLLGIDYYQCGRPHSDYLAGKVPRSTFQEAVLEMRGNSLPPIIRPKLDRSGLLTNILIDGARESRRQAETVREASGVELSK